jgi:sugar lactone lactonase YvrE
MVPISHLSITIALFPLLCLACTAMAHPDHVPGKDPSKPVDLTADVVTVDNPLAYQSVPGWFKKPEQGKEFGPTHGAIVVDQAGRIYCSMDSGEYGILVYRPNGSLLRRVAKGLTGLHGMCIHQKDGEEHIYAAHLSGRQVLKLKLDGSVVWTIKGPPMESGKYENPGQYKPTAVAVAPGGDIYVADGYGTSWIHQFDASRKYLRSFGGPSRFKTSHGLAIDPRGKKPLLLVCDRENRRLVHLDLDGTWIGVIAQGLRRPCSVAFSGEFLGVAELEGRVTVLNGSNQPVAYLGDNPQRTHWANYRVPVDQWREGVFTAPHGIAFDTDGNLFVMDWNASGRISRLDLVKE